MCLVVEFWPYPKNEIVVIPDQRCIFDIFSIALGELLLKRGKGNVLGQLEIKSFISETYKRHYKEELRKFNKDLPIGRKNTFLSNLFF